MTTDSISVAMVRYKIGSKVITLNKDLVDKYSDIVCPITEHLLATLIDAFENDSDAVISAKIETDMRNEIKEYGY